MWLPYNSKPNQIRLDHEKHQKHIVTELEGENEPIAYSNNIIGNYLVESFLGNLMRILHPFWKIMLHHKSKTILKQILLNASIL